MTDRVRSWKRTGRSLPATRPAESGGLLQRCCALADISDYYGVGSHCDWRCAFRPTWHPSHGDCLSCGKQGMGRSSTRPLSREAPRSPSAPTSPSSSPSSGGLSPNPPSWLCLQRPLEPVYGDIGLMQYFLRPRTIIDCPMGEDMAPCVRSMTGKTTYLLAVPDFPPQADASLYRDLVAFDAERGAYVPRGAFAEGQVPAVEDPIRKTFPTAASWTLDLLAVVCFAGIGLLLTKAIVPGADSHVAGCDQPAHRAGQRDMDHLPPRVGRTPADPVGVHWIRTWPGDGCSARISETAPEVEAPCARRADLSAASAAVFLHAARLDPLWHVARGLARHIAGSLALDLR